MANVHTQKQSDRAFQAHLADLAKAYNLISYLGGKQNELLSATLAIVGAVIAFFAIRSQTNMGQANAFDLAPLILLVSAALISALGLMCVETDIRIQHHGEYIQSVLTPKIQRLIGKADPSEFRVLMWEEIKTVYTPRNVVVKALSGVKYLVLYVPVFLLLLTFGTMRPFASTWSRLELTLFWINMLLPFVLVWGLLFIVAQDWLHGHARQSGKPSRKDTRP